MKYRVRIKDRSLPPGRVSLWAASLIMSTLRVALRSEMSTFASAKRAKTRSTKGRVNKLQRESMGVSLTGIESGTGVMVFEDEVETLINLPAQTFENMIWETNRNGSSDRANVGIQKALLNLEPLFRESSTIEWVEFIGDNEKGRLDYSKVERIKVSLLQAEPGGTTAEERAVEVVGRLLELNLASHTFEVHSIHEKPETISYADFMEPVVKEALESFVSARVAFDASSKAKDLVSLETLDVIADAEFYESASLSSIMAQQGIAPLTDFSRFGVEGVESVSVEEFMRFRREEFS